MLLAIDFSWCPLERGIRAPRRCHLQTWLGKDKSVRCSRQTALPGGPSGREWGFLYLAVLIMLPQHRCNIFSGSEQVAHALTCVHWATGWYITILTCTRCTDFHLKEWKALEETKARERRRHRRSWTLLKSSIPSTGYLPSCYVLTAMACRNIPYCRVCATTHTSTLPLYESLLIL